MPRLSALRDRTAGEQGRVTTESKTIPPVVRGHDHPGAGAKLAQALAHALHLSLIQPGGWLVDKIPRRWFRQCGKYREHAPQ